MKKFIIIRRMPSGVRGKFRYLYWDGVNWIADKREQAMEFNATAQVKKIAFALAQDSCAGYRHKPKLVQVEDW